MKITGLQRRTLRTTALLFVYQALLPGVVIAQTPILQYLFNETGTDAIDTGTSAVNLPMTQWDGATWNSADNHSADGTGVSGQPGDRAYFDPSLVLDPTQTPGASNSHYFGGFAGGFDLLEAQTLSTLTVQGWFKPPAGKKVGEVDGSFGALIGNLGSSTNDGGWVVRTTTTAQAGTLDFRYGEEDFTLNHVSTLSTAGIYSETDEWVFFAVTLDSASGNVEFFKGTATASVATAGSGNQGPLVGGAVTLSNRNFYIANSGSEGQAWSQGRAFNGSLDNLRIFDSVLTESQLEQLRLTDLEPPATLMGDYNADNKVDAADYVVWRKDPNAHGGDPDGYTKWRENFGLPSGSGAGLFDGAVPEPTVLALAGLMLGLLSMTRRCAKLTIR